MFNPDNVADMENNFEVVKVDPDEYVFIEDTVPEDDNIDDYEVMEPEQDEDPTAVVEPSRKKRRVRKRR